MFSRSFIFEGVTTPPAQREALRHLGFVHVTGLLYTSCPDWCVEEGEVLHIEAQEGDLGRFSHNNGLTVVVTEGGEVWLRSAVTPLPEEWAELREELCPNGEGAFVPLSNGEGVSPQDLLARVVDPGADIYVRQQG